MEDIKKGENRFYVGEENSPDAEITFNKDDNDNLVIDHTFVAPNMRGKGIGSELIQQVVKFARDEGRKIDPVCPFALEKFKETPEYRDVWTNN